MRILIFNWRDIKHEWAGGSETYIFELAKRWAKTGHSVTLFCGQDVRDKLPDEENILGIHVIRKGTRYSLYFWAFYYYVSKFRGNFDLLIDVENGIPFFTPLFSRMPKICIVHHVHNKQFFYEFPFPLSYVGFFAEQYIFPIFYRKLPVIAVSKTTKNELAKLGFNKARISVIYNGANGKGKEKKSTSGKFTHPTILYLGRIKKYKRVDMLIKIMPEVLKHVPNANMLIAGWGTEASSVIDMSMRSIGRRKVKIIGPVSEAEKKYLLSKAWVFVNPSIGEGWGISVIEANLHGTPAIAFKVAGLSESIQDNKTGLLVKSEKELVEKIIYILKNRKVMKIRFRHGEKLNEREVDTPSFL